MVEASKGLGSHEFAHFATAPPYVEAPPGFWTGSVRPGELKINQNTSLEFQLVTGRKLWLNPVVDSSGRADYLNERSCPHHSRKLLLQPPIPHSGETSGTEGKARQAGTGLTRHASRAPLRHFTTDRHDSCGLEMSSIEVLPCQNSFSAACERNTRLGRFFTCLYPKACRWCARRTVL